MNLATMLAAATLAFKIGTAGDITVWQVDNTKVFSRGDVVVYQGRPEEEIQVAAFKPKDVKDAENDVEDPANAFIPDSTEDEAPEGVARELPKNLRTDISTDDILSLAKSKGYAVGSCLGDTNVYGEKTIYTIEEVSANRWGSLEVKARTGGDRSYNIELPLSQVMHRESLVECGQ